MSSPDAFPLTYTRRWRDALELAERAHRGQRRKSGDKPYIVHPFVVSQILATAGADDDLVIAGYLHDVAEDTDVNLVEIEDKFGLRVRRLVEGVTKVEIVEGRRLSSAEKLQLTEERMESAHSDVVALKAADLIANMTDLVIDQQDHGYGHWEQMFKPGKLEHYSRLAEIIIARLDREQVYPRLSSTLSARLEQFRALLERWER